MIDYPLIFVKPKIPGNLVGKERGIKNWLSQDGEYVPHNVFWETRLRHGDVVIAEAPAGAAIEAVPFVASVPPVATVPSTPPAEPPPAADPTPPAEDAEAGETPSRKRARRGE